ncbi:MAG TPA: hypothetical protein ENK57_10610 [Polyangiaceae bacterium]|nr:hypothetical protein [Polyangiaceae bacterium]
MHNFERRQSLADFAAGLHEARSDANAERQLTREEVRERLEEVFGRVKAHEGHRVAVGWRVARAIAAAQGHLSQEEGLAVVPEAAWREHAASHVQGHVEGTPPWVIQIASAEVPILPHALLDADDGNGLDGYYETVCLVAARLGLRNDRPNRLGLCSLLDVLLGQEEEGVGWPEPWQLVALEDALVEEVFQEATSSPDAGGVASERRASNYLLYELGLTRPEAESVLAMARERAIRTMPTGQEALRALQFHALADGARRAAQSHDLKAEVAFRRLLAQVTGVTRTEPEDALGAFVQTVRRIAGVPVERPTLEPAKRELPAVPAGEPTARPVEGEMVEPSYDPDGEALRAFDEENG